jgi:integrase
MARTVRDTNLDTRTARLRLTPRRKPYWRTIEVGLHLGYRRIREGGGTWVARRFIGERRYSETCLGVADDLQDADGGAIMSFRNAQDAARVWWKGEERKALGLPSESRTYTVSDALKDYLAARERKGSKGVQKDRYAVDLRIIPDLGAVELAKLTPAKIRGWHEQLAQSDKLGRAPRLKATRKVQAFNAADPEGVRSRRSSANRVLTILKAALNYAYHEGNVTSDESWRKVKPFREVETAVVHYLSPSECVRLVNTCPPDFRALVRGALVTGCRYGELTRLKVADYHSEAGTISVRTSKAGKPRYVALNDEGRTLFEALTTGRKAQEFVFLREDGKSWGASHQIRPIKAASLRVGIEPAATFHILRHTYASALAMRGVPMGVIAAQLGHADTRMTEKHYAHLAPNYVADTIRSALPGFGIIGKEELACVANLHRG